MAAAGALRLLAVAAALAAPAHALPCPVVLCPPHQQGAPPPWQVLLLPPHGVVALVPGHVRLCPPHQLTAETPNTAAPNLLAEGALKTKPVVGELGTALTEWLASLPSWESLVSALTNAPTRLYGGGQLTDDGKKCAEETPSLVGKGR